MQVRNKKLLDEFRSLPRCELCGYCAFPLDPHHVRSVGSGRIEIRSNLMGVCRRCHAGIHAGKPSRAELLAFVAKREKMTVEAVLEAVDALRRDNSVKVRIDG